MLAASVGQYIKFGTAALLSMFAGSQCVHMIYRPLDGLEEDIAMKEKELLDEMESEIKSKVADLVEGEKVDVKQQK